MKRNIRRSIPFLILAAIIAVEHVTLGRWFRKHEYIRRSIGIATVLGWAYPIAIEEYGAYGENMWAVTATGFAVAGAVVTGLSLVEGK